MLTRTVFFLLFWLRVILNTQAEAACGNTGIWLQVLGSGGPEVEDKRASSSYLIWVDGRARIMIDAGGGAALRFGQSGAAFSDLLAIFFTHLHVDHSADLPVLIKSAFFENRSRDLLILGPKGNFLMPSVSGFVSAMFDPDRGAYRYLGNHLPGAPGNDWKIISKDLDVQPDPEKNCLQGPSFENSIFTSAIPVHHGPVPAIAWRIDIDGKSITFSGDMSNQWETLEKLAKDTDILVAHNAIPEGMTGVARRLHMPPSEIGRIAQTAHVKTLVLSHRMLRTLGNEEETIKYVKKAYHGPIRFANDLDCFRP